MGKRKLWTDESMEAAYKAVINGKGLREAARTHNVPVETLRRRVNGAVAMGCKPGPSTILSDEEEDLLCETGVEGDGEEEPCNTVLNLRA